MKFSGTRCLRHPVSQSDDTGSRPWRASQRVAIGQDTGAIVATVSVPCGEVATDSRRGDRDRSAVRPVQSARGASTRVTVIATGLRQTQMSLPKFRQIDRGKMRAVGAGSRHGAAPVNRRRWPAPYARCAISKAAVSDSRRISVTLTGTGHTVRHGTVCGGDGCVASSNEYWRSTGGGAAGSRQRSC